VAFKECRAEHIRLSGWAGSLALRFHGILADARGCLEHEGLPAAYFAERLPPEMVALLKSDPMQLSAEVLLELVTAQAHADLAAADELAAIPPPPEPEDLGWMWKDGIVRQEPEPTPEPVYLYEPGMRAA
jgi:hypothetical protein